MKYYKNESNQVYAYDDDYESVPENLIAMTEEEIAAHLNPPPPVLTHAQIEAMRLTAYADPQTGSDRHFAEANRLDAMGFPADAETSRQAGVKRYNEISDLYPWPETND